MECMQQAKGNQGILATYSNIYGGLQKKSPACETLCSAGAGERGAVSQGGGQLTSSGCHHWS